MIRDYVTTSSSSGHLIGVTAYDQAQRFMGLRETAGASSNPLILGMLRLDGGTAVGDDVPWCSAFVNFIAWWLRLPRSKSLAARSWLRVGRPIGVREAVAANDVVILKRGGGDQPGPEVTAAPGHVGFFGGIEGASVMVLGGNQGDEVSLAAFDADRVLGIRRLL